MYRNNVNLDEYCRNDLPLDTPTRFEYCPFCDEARSSLPFIVWRTAEGFRFYCHRCGIKKFIRGAGCVAPARTVLTRVEALYRHENNIFRSVYLPRDFMPEIPISGMRWLFENGVTPEEIKRFRIGYSPSMNRVILPVFQGEELVYWQGRRLSDNQDEHKYINVKVPRPDIWFDLIQPGDDSVVLVEDILSAIAIRRAGFSALALLGTNVPDKLLASLQRRGVRNVSVWLDIDKRGMIVQWVKRLNALGFRASAVLQHTKDPKCYSGNEITSFLVQGGHVHEEVPQARTSEAAPSGCRQANRQEYRGTELSFDALAECCS